ncbi:MAG: mechanosensitive ion channel family protein [Myxococcota bacterium]
MQAILERARSALATGGYDALLARGFDWGVALAVAFATWLALSLLRLVVLARIRRLADRVGVHRAAIVLQTLEKTRSLVLLVVSLYVGSLWLDLPERSAGVLRGIVTVALFTQVALWLIELVDAWLDRFRTVNLAENAAAVTSMAAVGFMLKLFVWVGALLLVLENLGVDITALVAGLGIGGIAVALAVQNILGDLFASLTIVIDKPFVVGDFLVLGDHLGNVERVGLKTTRLRSLSGELLVFSNTDLLGSRIHNYGAMYERRVLFGLGVVYQTSHAMLERIPGMLREAVEAQERVRFDRAHFKQFGPYSLDFEIVYFVLAPDYNLYMDIHQAVQLAIHARFEREGIEFAYPTRTLFLAAPAPDGRPDDESEAGAEAEGATAHARPASRSEGDGDRRTGST